MKKIILTIAFIATGLVASAQVGIGNTDPKVSLQVDRSTDNAQADGVLVTRVTVAELNAKAAAYGTDQNSALVFITAIAGATGQTSNVTATGFHYFDSVSSKWVALKGAAGANIYSNNGTLTAARTVDQNNNNLTFNTGTARAIVNGSFQTTGAVYNNVRTYTGSNNIDWNSTDYAVIVNNAGISNNLALPNASDNANRVLLINNATPGGINFIATVGQNRPVTTGALTGGRTGIFISDGSNWYALSK